MKQFPVAKRTLSHFKSIDPDPSPWHLSKNPLMISNLVAYEAKIYNRKHKKHRTFLKGHCDNSFAVSKSWLIDLKRNSIPCEPKGNIKSILSKNSSVLKFWRFLELSFPNLKMLAIFFIPSCRRQKLNSTNKALVKETFYTIYFKILLTLLEFHWNGVFLPF